MIDAQPDQTLANPDLLISVRELQKALSNPQLRLFDCRFALDNPDYGRNAYQQSHIPYAQYADINKDLSGPVSPGKTGRHPLPSPEAFLQRLRQWGVDETTSVVIYDDGNGAFAARLWWLLGWVGLHDVRILDGGFKAWTAANGIRLSSVPTMVESQYQAAPNPEWLVDASQVLQNLQLQEFILVDARGVARFRGEQEPIDPVAGHIPKARCFPYEGNVSDDGRFKASGELRQRFAPLTGHDVVCYCGSGVTACQNIFAMRLAGLPQARLYAGSWSEWITQPHRPVALGDA